MIQNFPRARINANNPRMRDRTEVQVIPFDYVSTFYLRGERIGELHEDVINISVDGTFIAVAVGYGLAADTAVHFDMVNIDNETKLSNLTLANVPPHVLMDGFRFNPALEHFAFIGEKVNNEVIYDKLDESIDVALANEKGLFKWMRPVNDFNFLFSIIDTGSGREIQNAPIHNIAGLGKTNGERPFRTLAKPLAFLPRSSIRIQVEERSLETKGMLYMVLHGYKILGASGIPEQQLRLLYQRAMQFIGPRAASQQLIDRVENLDIPSTKIIPFDYVSRMKLMGKPNNIVEDEININVEGGFVATSVGYSLSVENTGAEIFSSDHNNHVNLKNVKLSEIKTSDGKLAVKDGFRIRPQFQRLAFNNGQLSTLPKTTADALFELLNLPDNVNFLYYIVDTGTGREWQNQPVQNISGLGIANGDRPFRQLAWPMHFLPRSTIRIRIEELFGRGNLFIVFQGYKLLGTL